MINIIENTSNNVIGVEFIDGYSKEDEKHLERLFEEKLASGITQINILAKIDNLTISKSSWKAMWDDSIYGLKHFKNCGKIAIIGNSNFESLLIKIDNAFFINKKKNREEKYFHIDEMEKALEWVS